MEQAVTCLELTLNGKQNTRGGQFSCATPVPTERKGKETSQMWSPLNGLQGELFNISLPTCASIPPHFNGDPGRGVRWAGGNF